MYPEINRGNPIKNLLRAKTALIKSKLAAQPTTTALILSPTLKQEYSIWGNVPGSKTTTLTPATTASSNPSLSTMVVTRGLNQQKQLYMTVANIQTPHVTPPKTTSTKFQQQLQDTDMEDKNQQSRIYLRLLWIK